MDAILAKKELKSISEQVIDAAQVLLQDTVTSEKLGTFIETCIKKNGIMKIINSTLRTNN